MSNLFLRALNISMTIEGFIHSRGHLDNTLHSQMCWSQRGAEAIEAFRTDEADIVSLMNGVGGRVKDGYEQQNANPKP